MGGNIGEINIKKLSINELSPLIFSVLLEREMYTTRETMICYNKTYL